MRDFNRHELASTAWAYAALGHAAPALFDAIAAAAHQRLRDFTPLQLSNMAWAFAKLRHSAEGLLDAIASMALPRLRDFKLQELENTTWAYEAAGIPAFLTAAESGGAAARDESKRVSTSREVSSGALRRNLLDAIEAEVKRREDRGEVD